MTLYATEVVIAFPTLSVAVTPNDLSSTEPVSMFAPFATGPTQVSEPEPPSAQENAETTL